MTLHSVSILHQKGRVDINGLRIGSRGIGTVDNSRPAPALRMPKSAAQFSMYARFWERFFYLFEDAFEWVTHISLYRPVHLSEIVGEFLNMMGGGRRKDR